jgi:aspartate oxidase
MACGSSSRPKIEASKKHQKMSNQVDILIVGAGHAGVQAAIALLAKLPLHLAGLKRCVKSPRTDRAEGTGANRRLSDYPRMRV